MIRCPRAATGDVVVHVPVHVVGAGKDVATVRCSRVIMANGLWVPNIPDIKAQSKREDEG